MPSVPRPGIKPYYFECPQKLWDALVERCQKTLRTPKAELTLALDHWLRQPLAFLPESQPAAEETAAPKRRKK